MGRRMGCRYGNISALDAVGFWCPTASRRMGQDGG